MIKGINYENETRLLEVSFINGVIFRYFDVPSQIATSFISSNTNVEFFNKNIINQVKETRLIKKGKLVYLFLFFLFLILLKN